MPWRRCRSRPRLGHRADQAVSFEGDLDGPASELHTPVRMNHTTSHLTASGNGVLSCLDTKRACIRSENGAPTIPQEHTSFTARRESLPSVAGCSVMSVNHTRFDAGAVKFD